MASKNARRFHPKLISLAVASCFAVSTAYAQQAVLPTGANPISGISSVITNGNTMDVTTNLNRSLIQWNTFSIGQGATVNFNQPSSISAVLNRVMGGVPSEILGAMNSNGRVVLINTSGITFGATAQINLPGLVASTLNLSDADFLANRLRFTDGAGAGSVINNANFHTAPGGEVYLIGKSVTNNGTITTPQGEVILAAGNSVELVSPGTPNLRVEVTAPDNQAVNLGTIVADAGRVGIYAGLVRQGGTIRADGVQMTDDGRIVLKATKNVTVDAGSVTSASGPKGGTVEIHSGDTTLVYGDVSATGSADKGGTVSVLGNLVGVLGDATIDASGATGGGTVLVGGDFQGKNPAIPNAYRTFFGPDATIKADATVNGDGGKVIVWSDDATRAFGTISARGGAEGGDGGFVEVSGKRWLEFHASVDTRAPKGKTGTLLLDPQDVHILSGTCCGAEGQFFGGDGGPSIWTPNGSNSTSVVYWGDAESSGTIIQNLQSNDVIITTSSNGNMNGDITVVGSADYTSNNALTLAADRHINVLSGVSIVNNANGDITLAAGLTVAAGSIGITNNTIETGGSIALAAAGDINIGSSLLSAGRSNSGRSSMLSVSAGGNVLINGESMLRAVGGDNGAGNGFNGTLSVTGTNVSIDGSLLLANGGFGEGAETAIGGIGHVVVTGTSSVGIASSELSGNGGSGTAVGGAGHVTVSGGNVEIDNSALFAQGGFAGGGEGFTGTGGLGHVHVSGNNIGIFGSTLEGIGGDGFVDGGRGQVTVAGGSVNISGSTLFAGGAEGLVGIGGIGQVHVSGSNVSIFDSLLEGIGGEGGVLGGHGQVTVDASGSLTIDEPFSNSTEIVARGGHVSCCGPEGSSGGLATVFLNAGGALSIFGGATVEAHGGDSGSGPGGGAAISLFGGSVYIGTSSSQSIYARGGQGSNSWAGGGASISVFGNSVTIDGTEGAGLFALGGNGGMLGGNAAISIGSGSTLNVIHHADVIAQAGNGSTGGSASIGLTALNDVIISDSHVEAEGANSSSGGSAVVLVNSTLGGILIDHTHCNDTCTVMANVLNGVAEVTLKAFDIISVTEDFVEANFFESGGSASINLHFTGRTSGGFFVNGVEGVTTAPLPSNPEGSLYGFFVNGAPAQDGVNFFVTYSGALPDPCLLAPEICAPPRLEPPNINEASEQVGTGGDKKKKDEPVCRG